MSKNLLLLSAEKLVDAENFEAATMAIAELHKYSWTEKTRREWRSSALGSIARIREN